MENTMYPIEEEWVFAVTISNGCIINFSPLVCKTEYPFIWIHQSSLTLFTRYRETVQEGYLSDDSQQEENNIAQHEMDSDDNDDEDEDDEK